MELDWLYEFQREDVTKLVDRKSALIANEMGTGKTYEAIALDLWRREDIPEEWSGRPKTLVIAPLTVTHSWEQHFKDLAPELKLCKMDPKKRGDFLSTLYRDEADVFICHWESLRLINKDINQRGIVFHHIIADEVHRAKNRKAQQSRALKSFKGRYRTGLSGTPVTNKPHDLWNILDWLQKGSFGAYWTFYKRYVEYELTYPHEYHKVIGPKNVEELHQRMSGFYVRRRKVDVLKDLPDKYYDTIWVELDPKQRRAYDQMKKEMIAWLENQDETKPLVAPVVIAQLIRLQQLAAAYADVHVTDDGTTVTLTEPSSKIDALMQLLEDNPDESIVVFSQFKQLINLAAKRMAKAEVPFVTITGDVGQDGRRDAIERFQSGEARVFLGTIAAGGEGITLTRARTVVFLDRDWSPGRNTQAEDRLHRIGQKNAVEVIDIVARNTIDLGRMQKIEMKKQWIAYMLDGKMQTQGGITVK